MKGINMEIKNGQFSSIEQVAGQYLNHKSKESTLDNVGMSFDALLRQQLTLKEQQQAGTELKFSKHADARLAQRNITLSDEQMKRLEDGTRKAGEKGIKESLVLMDSLAFIVNTRNNTVITAMEQSSNDENIYTNIDGAVII